MRESTTPQPPGPMTPMKQSCSMSNSPSSGVDRPKIFAVDRAKASDASGNPPFHRKNIFFFFTDPPSGMPGRDSCRRVSVERCKPCRGSDETDDLSKCLPADLVRYALNSFGSKSPTLPRRTRRHLNAAGTPRGRTNRGPPTRPQP